MKNDLNPVNQTLILYIQNPLLQSLLLQKRQHRLSGKMQMNIKQSAVPR